MADDVVAALDTVMAAATPWDYLVARDAAVPVCRAKYDALCEVADGHPDADVRWEALQMISLIGADDHRARLQFALETDVDDRVRECAEVLLFRSRVRERVVASGRLTPEGVDAYVRSVREGAARHFFKQPS